MSVHSLHPRAVQAALRQAVHPMQEEKLMAVPALVMLGEGLSGLVRQAVRGAIEAAVAAARAGRRADRGPVPR